MSLLSRFAFAAPINAKCPVEGGETAGKQTSEVAVHFCCNKCKGLFDKDPVKYLGILANTKDGDCPVSEEEADKEISSTLIVGTCCKDCKATFEADPKKYLGKLK